jgi:carotenoid cleavage dioxygenase-like enzyme
MMHDQKFSFFEGGIKTPQHIYTMNDVPVTGKIPEWINGSYIRNGPGLFNDSIKSFNHWFDAMGVLHKFDLREGKVSYQNRFIECESYRHVKEEGRLHFSEFATDPCKSIFKKIQSYVFPTLPNMTDNPKISVAKIGKKWMALGETPMQVEFDPDTLEKIGVAEPVPGAFAYKTTAHPHFDGEHAFNLVVKFGMQSYYRIYDLTKPGEKPLCNIPVKRPAYIHGFGMTKNYFIIAAGPLTVTPIELLFWKRPFIENHQWRKNDGGSIYVIDKKTGKLKTLFKTEAFFCFHHINAWEEKDTIIMDLNAYEDASIIQHYYLNKLQDETNQLPAGVVKRFILNLSTRSYETFRISDACIELPRIDYERYNTQNNYRYTYGVSLHPENQQGFYNSIVKIDAQNGDSIYWRADHCYPGEPFFASKPNSRNDEEGVLISIVLDVKKGNSFLLFLDAITMQEIARATLPEPIVYGFHADYFPQ